MIPPCQLGGCCFMRPLVLVRANRQVGTASASHILRVLHRTAYYVMHPWLRGLSTAYMMMQYLYCLSLERDCDGDIPHLAVLRPPRPPAGQPGKWCHPNFGPAACAVMLNLQDDLTLGRLRHFLDGIVVWIGAPDRRCDGNVRGAVRRWTRQKMDGRIANRERPLGPATRSRLAPGAEPLAVWG